MNNQPVEKEKDLREQIRRDLIATEILLAKIRIELKAFRDSVNNRPLSFDNSCSCENCLKEFQCKCPNCEQKKN